mmetsp:Transcript_20264/g.38109  ORF Transcript_20264/g.38109 Transcript_20264/m.38109 type:complete len:373 (-) Transcript_20264:146-1264(-)
MDITSGAAVCALLFNDYDISQRVAAGTHQREGFNKSKCEKGEHMETTLSSTTVDRPLRVLDLCCSPGLKLCAIADLIQSCPGSSVTGVDISESRMNVTKKVVKKYHIDMTSSGRHEENVKATQDVSILLYCMDGTTFGTKPLDDLAFHSTVANEHARTAGKRKRMNKSARARERKRLRQLSSHERMSAEKEYSEPSKNPSRDGCLFVNMFDRVLVDAECSTDGALRHMQQRRQKQQNTAKKTGSNSNVVTDPARLAELVDLQKRLIASGFRLLKPGGILVYSTCSLSIEQNENIVSWFLNCAPDACLVPVSFSTNNSASSLETKDCQIFSEGSIAGTCRFVPKLKGTELGPLVGASGFFLAKLMKKGGVREK